MILLNPTYLNSVDLVWTNAAYIRVEEGKICEIGEQYCPSLFPEDEKLDFNGKYILPGLIDMHVHISESYNRASSMFSEVGVETYTKNILENGREALRYGITTVRDMGSRSGILSKIISSNGLDLKNCPEIIHCGEILTYSEGHMAECGVALAEAEAIQDVVMRNKKLGAAFTKIASDPEDVEAQNRDVDPTLSPEILKSIVEESRALNMHTACHTFPSIVGVDRALSSQVKTIEHAVPLTPTQAYLAAKSEVFFVPTMVAAIDDVSPSLLKRRYSIDPAEMEKWEIAAGDGSRLILERDKAPPESIITWLDRLVQYLPAALGDKGVKVLLGSDAGCPGTAFGSLIREMNLHLRYCNEPLKIIQAATFNAATALGRKDLGRIEVGAKANLVVYSANPSHDFYVLANPEMVMKDGWFVSL